MRLRLLIALALIVAAWGACKESPPAASGPAGSVVSLTGPASAERDGVRRELSIGSDVFASDVIATEETTELVIHLAHNDAAWTIRGARTRRVDQSPAWRAPKGATAGFLDPEGEGRTSAAGAHTERESGETVATAPEATLGAAEQAEVPGTAAEAKLADKPAREPDVASAKPESSSKKAPRKVHRPTAPPAPKAEAKPAPPPAPAPPQKITPKPRRESESRTPLALGETGGASAKRARKISTDGTGGASADSASDVGESEPVASPAPPPPPPPPPPKPKSVQLTLAVTTLSHTATKQAADSVARALRVSMATCAADATPGERIVVTVDIDASGKVSNVRVASKTAAAACARSKAAGLVIGEHPKKAWTQRLQLRFSGSP